MSSLSNAVYTAAWFGVVVTCLVGFGVWGFGVYHLLAFAVTRARGLPSASTHARNIARCYCVFTCYVCYLGVLAGGCLS